MSDADLQWVPDEHPVWDADKQRIIGGAPEGAFVIPWSDGEALPGEWWSAREGDTIVGYGRLDIGWGGDAEILLAVDPQRQEEGIGTFVLGALEGEALRRGINYVYNTVPDHSERVIVHDWFVIRGFRGPIDGDLRKRVAFARQAPTPGEVETDARPGPSRAASGGGSYDPETSGDMGPGHEESGGYVDVDDHRY